MSRQAATLIIAAAGICIALAVASFVQVPYVALTPGPTLNTLGKANGHLLVTVDGHRTYPTTGHLNMVTVSFIGGPGTNFNIFAALQAWLSPNEAVVPEREIFPVGQSQRQVLKQDTEQMVNSQQTATAAALCQLGIRFKTVDAVTGTIRGLPAAAALRHGDVIAAVNGTPVTCRTSAAALIRSRAPGTPVKLKIIRNGKPRAIRLTTARYQGASVIGVSVVESFVFPFTVKIDIGNIGGPSAGLMFALAIIDKLSPANLTGGRFIAGTGAIEAKGAVDPIGGIQQKMVGARNAGATVFLTPAANCPETAGAIPAGLRLIKVSTLSGAIAALQALRNGQPVASC
jgi:PDZ domain-containing protein